MSAGVWIFLGLVVVAFAILKNRGTGGAKAPEKRSLTELFERKDALVPQIVQECVRAAQELPIVDSATSWLHHDPVYDARTDMFDPPCKDDDFRRSTGDCWLTLDTLPKAFERFAESEAGFRLELSRPRADTLVAAGDHIDVVTCVQSIDEPGVYVRRLSRVSEGRWHEHFFQCGMGNSAMGLVAGNARIVLASGSDGVDPPIKAVDVAHDPSLWTRRTDELRRLWPSNADWRDATRLCDHRS
jgi:hypothetical protein